MVILSHNGFRVLFDEIAYVYFIWKIYLYFSIGNGQTREPALCQLYRHTFVSYVLIPAKAGAQTGTPRDALAPYPWYRSLRWCLAEGYRNGDQRRPMGPCDLEKTFWQPQTLPWPTSLILTWGQIFRGKCSIRSADNDGAAASNTTAAAAAGKIISSEYVINASDVLVSAGFSLSAHEPRSQLATTCSLVFTGLLVRLLWSADPGNWSCEHLPCNV